jgi:hypothetical protein
MTEVKTNIISGLGTAGLKFDSPVGISANSPSTSGLNIEGHVEVVNSGAEVVTVAGESFGLNIKAPKLVPPLYKVLASTLQFADRDGIRRNVITSEGSNNLSFVTGTTGPVMTNANTLTGGMMYMNTATELNNKNKFLGATAANFNNATKFDYGNFPRCSGIPSLDEHLINVNVLRQWILNITTMKTWSVFGTLDNGGIKLGKQRSGNFFKRLFGLAKPTCCCGCQTLPGSYDQGVYNQVLQGTWLIIGFSRSNRACSCYDNEEFHYPVDASAVWSVTNDSVRNTLPAHLSGTYDLFGFAIRPLDISNITS